MNDIDKILNSDAHALFKIINTAILELLQFAGKISPRINFNINVFRRNGKPTLIEYFLSDSEGNKQLVDIIFQLTGIQLSYNILIKSYNYAPATSHFGDKIDYSVEIPIEVVSRSIKFDNYRHTTLYKAFIKETLKYKSISIDIINFGSDINGNLIFQDFAYCNPAKT